MFYTRLKRNFSILSNNLVKYRYWWYFSEWSNFIYKKKIGSIFYTLFFKISLCLFVLSILWSNIFLLFFQLKILRLYFLDAFGFWEVLTSISFFLLQFFLIIFEFNFLCLLLIIVWSIIISSLNSKSSSLFPF